MKRFRYICLALSTLLLVACANIGSPEGGPVDYTPPVVLKSSPQNGTVNFMGNKVEINFDEIVNIKDQQKKVVVSPTQRETPIIKSLGKKITVELRDSLKPNTTYVIDFSNAIVDNNEGNPLDGYAFTFSTGANIDSLRISGIVLEASSLEPMQHVLVGVHSCLDDTAFIRQPFERITRTNDRGQFTIMGLHEGRYHIFALNDVDGDNRMNRSESYAFLDEVIVPSAATFTSQDTVFTFDHRIDTVMEATHTDFLPNNVLLSMFNEGYKSHYLKTASRPEAHKLHIQFSAPADTLPRLELLSPRFTQEPWYLLERTEKNDSLYYWITDSALIKCDSLKVAMNYLFTDTADQLAWRCDTLTFAVRKTSQQLKEEAQEKKELEQQKKRRAQLIAKREQGKELNEEEEEELKHEPAVEEKRLKVEFARNGSLEVYDSVMVKVDAPLAHIDPNGVHLLVKRDTLWVPLDDLPQLQPRNEYDLFTYALPLALESEASYRCVIDAGAMTSVYGLTADTITAEFKVKMLEDYANLYVRVNVPDSAFIDLLAPGEKFVRRLPVTGGQADFTNITPGTYFLRLTLDANGNGIWDPGNYDQHLQPEEVYYYPKPVKLRRGWDVEQQWNIYETALDLQKPNDIRRNKPEQSGGRLQKAADAKKISTSGNDDEEDDEFNSSGFSGSSYSGNKYNDYQNNNKLKR